MITSAASCAERGGFLVETSKCIQKLQAAFEADDRERAEHERWLYKQQQASMVKKDALAAPDIVYKVSENALCDDASAYTLRTEQQTADPWDGWNRWADGRIATYVKANIERELLDLAEEVGTITGRMERELRGEIAKLRADFELQRQLGELRTEIEKLKAKSNGTQ